MAEKIKRDFFKQEIKIGDWVVCHSSSGSTGMYLGKVTKLTDHKVQLTQTNGAKHQKSFNKVFVVTAQVDTVPELMI